MAEAAFKRKVEDLMKNYSDEQLQELLIKHNLDKMPLIDQTRSVLIKKLARKIENFEGTCSNYNEPNDQAPTLTQSSFNILSSTSTSSDGKTDTKFKDKTSEIYEKQVSSESCASFTSSSQSDIRHTYYLVCIPGPTSTITVHDNFPDVMKIMKEHKGKNPRMLSFNNCEKAEEFASTHTALEVCEGATIKSAYPQEKAEVESGEVKLFPSLTPPQINQFRIQLERGNLSFAKECIMSNPRFLIGNGDMPTIVKEGPRYNAMHACVMAGRLESCRLVMETVSNIDYLCRMYTTQKRAEESSLRLIDLYLNTPDKTANKTPLYLASEKGMVDIVAFLVSFKACIRKFNRQVSAGKDTVIQVANSTLRMKTDNVVDLCTVAHQNYIDQIDENKKKSYNRLS
ncbi:ankyrin repeat and lem domain-containing protein 2 [Plakobranchus ocellatus]|uniref:Ankyrin repeat and lem domain-containing protein 2 n=1 Tax=Plakobranchus ocellatus TaxID=259542 RepID=A0AAV3Y4S4_9GAST|nr:ankyrin repeat and lem domain-containing protein 2 [Plakobranchus ocellatus]